MPTVQELKTQLIELFQQRDELHNRHAALSREQEPIKALATEIKRIDATLAQPLSPENYSFLLKHRYRTVEQYDDSIKQYNANPYRELLDQQRHVVQSILEDRNKEIDILSKQIQQMENPKTIQPAQFNAQQNSTDPKESNKPSMPQRSPVASNESESDSRAPSPLRLN